MRFRRDTDAGPPPVHAREFVDPGMTPAFLVRLFDEYISSDAEKIVAPQAGKWMRVAGPRGLTVPRRRGVTLMRFDHDILTPQTRVEMRFREIDARQHLDAIPRGTEIVVVGKIASITRSQVILDQCEVEEANPRSPIAF